MKYIENIHKLNIYDFENENEIFQIIHNSKKINIINFIYFNRFAMLDKDTDYLNSLKNAELVLIDGIGMQLYLKSFNGVSVNNFNGTDLTPSFLEYLKKNDCKNQEATFFVLGWKGFECEK